MPEDFIEPKRVDRADGTYTLMSFFNAAGDLIPDTEPAARVIIRDFDASGKMLHETWGTFKPSAA